MDKRRVIYGLVLAGGPLAHLIRSKLIKAPFRAFFARLRSAVSVCRSISFSYGVWHRFFFFCISQISIVQSMLLCLFFVAPGRSAQRGGQGQQKIRAGL